VLAVLALTLVACGGGYSSAPKTTTTNSSGGAKKPATRFSVADVSGVGKVLVDAKGRTVYILTSSAKKNVPCTDANGCTAVWPDLPLPDHISAATAGIGLDASLLGTMKESDGETYPTYNGYLMYEYTGDSGSGQANGEGLTSFGGTWYALSPSGNPVKQSSSGGYGGGY
jgi:predicted lipoprotein with Yx(FWY)xxD motif